MSNLKEINRIKKELGKGLKIEYANGLIVEALIVIAKQNEETIKLLDKIRSNTTPLLLMPLDRLRN